MIVAAARRLGCTEGQVYTLLVGLLLAMLLTVAGTHGGAQATATGLPLQSQVIGSPQTLPTYPGGPVVTVLPPTLTPTPLGGFPSLAPGAGTTGGQPEPMPTGDGDALSGSIAIGPALFARIGRPGAPSGIAVAPDGRVFVSTNNGADQGVAGPSMVFGFGPTGKPQTAVGVTGQPQGHADGLGALAYASNSGLLYTVDRSNPGQILVVDPAARTTKTAVAVPDLIQCGVPLGGPAPTCEPGATDHLPNLTALAVDPQGRLMIADGGQGTIWRWTPGRAQAEIWYQSVDFGTGDGPAGLAFDGPAKLLVTVGATNDQAVVDVPPRISVPPGTDTLSPKGALYSFEITPTSAAGTRVLVADFPVAAKPGPVVVDASRITYVLERGTGKIDWLSGSAAAVFSVKGAKVPVDGPADLAVSNGRLLVTNQSPSNKAANWAVLSFPLIGA